MRTAGPQVAGPRYRVLGQRRSRVGSLLVGNRQQPIDLARVEAREAEIEIRLTQFLQLQGEQFFIPVRPRNGSIHHEPESLYLSICPFIAEDHRDTGYVTAGPRSQLARCLNSEVTVN